MNDYTRAVDFLIETIEVYVPTKNKEYEEALSKAFQILRSNEAYDGSNLKLFQNGR